ncbi:MAG: c-type cytochrome [Pseudomonadota bacterium]
MMRTLPARRSPSRSLGFLGGAAFAAAVLAAGPAAAADRLTVLGEQFFVDECAVCHGLDARGEGPLAAVLSVEVPDLSRAAARNEGVFPFGTLYKVIDGRAPVAGHGPSEMPVWGAIFRGEVAREGATGGYRGLDAELLVAGRITAILMYLEAIQRP